MESYRITKEKLKLALNTERTINFLKNDLNNKGLGLANATPNLNRFLKELVRDNDNIKIINKGNRKKIINDIEIYNKKILIRTNSVCVNNTFKISFESFRYEREDNIDFTNVFNIVNNKIDYYNYIFLIRIEEEEDKNNEYQLKACYHYYLFPTEIFKINNVEKINFDNHRRRASLSSEYWTFKSYNNFHLKYNNDLLMQYNIYPSHINC